MAEEADEAREGGRWEEEERKVRRERRGLGELWKG
eukprot:CAMPEP_0201525964 /NCGR_PEP_ID=MMETSP0161_2-20130828/30191_1 /ASSEMBLY_ACC=CAM_ASM_000251 /TAXON_ID=180227 /ORGANISM="Neoparamoeba aestuarina, Strain SoJaBio B1-5/56/2" /LENGTH=34 /DNA_ID= /DNA_START= /DNA_END= /DNA_ORIENTATION=